MRIFLISAAAILVLGLCVAIAGFFASQEQKGNYAHQWIGGAVVALIVMYIMGTQDGSDSCCRFNWWNLLNGVVGFAGICLIGCWVAIVKNWAQGRYVQPYLSVCTWATIIFVMACQFIPDTFDPDDPADRDRAIYHNDNFFGELYHDFVELPKHDLEPAEIPPERLEEVIRGWNKFSPQTQAYYLDKDSLFGDDRHAPYHSWTSLTEAERLKALHRLGY